MLEYLKQISPYNELDEEDLTDLVRIATKRHYKKNTMVIIQGDDTDSLYILLDGKMKVFIEDDTGKELTVRLLNSGDSFGELALIGEFPRSANVQALSNSTVFTISKNDYMQFLGSHPKMAMSMIRSLANMVRETTEELRHIALSDVYGRIAYTLEKHAVDRNGERCIPKFTHREIANMIGASREMVSKVMKELEKGEYVTVEEKQYVMRRELPARW